MTTLQIILMMLSIAGLVYELMQIGVVVGFLSKYGHVHLTAGFYIGLLIAVAIQTAFIVSIAA